MVFYSFKLFRNCSQVRKKELEGKKRNLFKEPFVDKIKSIESFWKLYESYLTYNLESSSALNRLIFIFISKMLKYLLPVFVFF